MSLYGAFWDSEQLMVQAYQMRSRAFNLPAACLNNEDATAFLTGANIAFVGSSVQLSNTTADGLSMTYDRPVIDDSGRIFSYAGLFGAKIDESGTVLANLFYDTATSGMYCSNASVRNILSTKDFTAKGTGFEVCYNTTNTPIYEFPPVAMSGVTTTVVGQAEGNGDYTAYPTSLGGSTFAWWIFKRGATTLNYAIGAGNLYGIDGYYTGTVSTGTPAYKGEFFQITGPSAIYLDSFDLTSVQVAVTSWLSASPRDFRIYGSNDGTNFTYIYESTGQMFALSETKTYSVASTVAYSTFRIVCNRNQGTAGTAWRFSLGNWLLRGRTEIDMVNGKW